MHAWRAAACACVLWSLLAAPAACQAPKNAAGRVTEVEELAAHPMIVESVGAVPLPVRFTQADTAALSDALSVLEAAAPAAASSGPGARLYTSFEAVPIARTFEAVPSAGAEDVGPMTPDDRLRCATLALAL